GVRMALHTGEVRPKEGGYFGPTLDQAARLLSAVHGGQIVCSEATAFLLSRVAEPGLRVVDLGAYRLRGVETVERFFQVNFEGMRHQKFPPLDAEPGYSSNLPLQLTRFFGREQELSQLRNLLLDEGTRLGTVTGPGGVGKTRFALESAKQLLEPLCEAVWFVPLADLSDPGLIASAVLESMRLVCAPNLEPLEQVIEALSRQRALLVLDNFEQLATGGASVVGAMLERGGALKCLITSRRRLNMEGEREFPLPPLPGRDGAARPERLILNDSVRLFIDRAQTARPDFQVTRANAAAVAQLCARLEGIPLALELAAAKAQVLTPAQMLARLVERFDLLVSKRRRVTERHRTLRAAIDWSYQLLAPELQKFFARLSVFGGGWTLEAAETVCEEPMALDYLAQLRDCSLILIEDEEHEARFRML